MNFIEKRLGQKMNNISLTRETNGKSRGIIACCVALTFLFQNIIGYSIFIFTKFEEENTWIAFSAHRIFMVGYLLAVILIAATLLVQNRKKINRLCCILASVAVSIILSIYVLLIYKGEFLAEIIDFVIIINVAYIMAYCMYEYKIYDRFTVCIEKLAILYSIPLMYYSYLMLTDSNPYRSGTYLGDTQNYQQVAFAALPLILSFAINFIFHSEKPVFGRIKCKGFNFIRIILIIIVWCCVIIPGGTRSIILGVLLFGILSVVFSLVVKKHRIRSTLVVIVLLIGFISQMLFPLNEFTRDKMMMFIGGVFEGKLVSAEVDLEINTETYSNDENIIENIVKNPNTEETKELLGSRSIMLQVAIMEGLEAPFTGLGAKGYNHKYQTYPHNAAAELIADFGIIVGSILLIGLLYLAVRLIIAGIKDLDLLAVLLFISAYIIPALSSGSLYESVPIFFVLGLGVSFIVNNDRRNKKNDKQIK